MVSSEEQRRALLERVARIVDILEGVLAQPESLSDGAADLVRFAMRSMDSLVDNIADRWRQASKLPTIEEREHFKARACARCGRVLRELETAIVPALDGAKASNIPFEVEPHLRRLCLKLAPDWNVTAIVLASEHRLNYSIGRYAAPSWLTDMLAVRDPNPANFIQFVIPRVARDSLPLHGTLLGHELGHLREWHSPILTEPAFASDQPDEYNAATSDPAQLLHFIKLYQQIRSGWLSELVADVYSVLLLGPAAIFALQELSMTVGAAGDTASHPAFDRRIAVMLTVLEGSGFLNDDFDPGIGMGTGLLRLLDLYRPSLERDSEPVAASPPVVSHLKLVWRSILPAIPQLIARCRDNVPEDVSFRLEHWDDVVAASSRLQRGLTAGERATRDTVRPFSVAVILNAAWVVKRSSLDRLAAELPNSGVRLADLMRANAILEQLTLKSLAVASYRERI